MRIIVLLLLALLGSPTSGPSQTVGSAQTKPKGNPDLIITSMAGRDLFQFYCASCHGRDGKGKGFAASALKKAPPDLTTLAERHRGTFPTDTVTAIIKGEKPLGTPAHGSREMPVWGPIFTGLDDRPAVNEARIENIVKHIESMQPKPKATPAPAAMSLIRCPGDNSPCASSQGDASSQATSPPLACVAPAATASPSHSISSAAVHLGRP